MPRKKAEKERGKKERGNGRGTVWELPDSRWRWQLNDFSTGKRVALASGYAPNKTAAEDALAQAVSDKARGLLAIPDTITVSEYFDKWLARQRHLRPRTRTLYTRQMGYALEYIGKKQVREVRAFHLKEMLAALAVRPVASSRGTGQFLCGVTLGKVVTLVRTLFLEAVSDQIIYHNPAQAVKRPKTQAVKNEDTVTVVLDLPQLARFLEIGTALHVSGEFRLWPALLTAVSIGLRRSEVMGLRWSDVDFEANTIWVRQGLVSDEGKLTLSVGGKTENATRDIPIPDRLRAVLLAHRDAQVQAFHEAGTIWEPDSPVFATALGTFTHPDNLNRALRELLKWSDPAYWLEKDKRGVQRGHRVFKREHRAMLETVILSSEKLPNISPHDLRHTYATTAIRQNPANVELVSKILGHAKVSITLDIYRHVLSSEKRSRVVDVFRDVALPARDVRPNVVN